MDETQQVAGVAIPTKLIRSDSSGSIKGNISCAY
jgi:hypothetical protein